MRLYFVRHGSTDANPSSVPDPTTGEVNEPLNKQGISQANRLAQELNEIHLDAILSSPMKRAYQTAELINHYRHLSIDIDDVWRERGVGAHVSLEVWHDLFDFDKNFSLEKSEDLRIFFKRIYDALDLLKEKCQDKTVLLVSHAGVHQAVYAYANKLPLKGNGRVSPLHNCEYRIYDI